MNVYWVVLQNKVYIILISTTIFWIEGSCQLTTNFKMYDSQLTNCTFLAITKVRPTRLPYLVWIIYVWFFRFLSFWRYWTGKVGRHCAMDGMFLLVYDTFILPNFLLGFVTKERNSCWFVDIDQRPRYVKRKFNIKSRVCNWNGINSRKVF